MARIKTGGSNLNSTVVTASVDPVGIVFYSTRCASTQRHLLIFSYASRQFSGADWFPFRPWAWPWFSQAVQEAPHGGHERCQPSIDVGRRPDA